MVDINYLKKQGISSGSYRKVFSAKPADYPKRVADLTNLISQRVKDGRWRNMREWRTYAAIDVAYEAPFAQTTPTMINHLLSKNLTIPQWEEAIKEWGLSSDELFLRVKAPDGTETVTINPPVFYQIFIPIVRAYVSIREAKIFNDRNQPVLLPYQPLKSTSRNMVLCEIVTDLIQTISTWYGYSAVMRQAIHQALKYGVMLAFPEEEWHHESQLREPDPGRTKPSEYTVKEGLRYIIPHPTRMFYDMRRPLTRLNTDTGCEWAGTWWISSYGDVLDNRLYWNRKKIFCGTNWLEAQVSGSYFKEFYPCTLAFPAGTGNLPLTREDIAAYYNAGNRDQAVFLTQFFMKLVPKDWGLGEYSNGNLVKTYDRPVWHRFILAGDDTVVFAQPCAYAPVWFMGYDYDEMAGKNSSLALECIPWQDHLGNILSQMILTAKQNLMNVTFYDKQIVDVDDVRKLENSGEGKYRSMNWIGYDSMLHQKAGLNVDRAFHSVQLQPKSIVELLQMIPMMLNIMERVLQISAQEAGAAASHQQSKAEVIMTGGAATNRVVFTSSGIDEGIDAWKRQLYDAAKAYMDPTISAQVSAEIPDLLKHLQELGFTVTDRGTDRTLNRDILLVKGNKDALRLEGFAATNRGPEPQKEKEIAQVIFQTVGIIGARPEMVQAVGVQNLLTLIEQGARLAGAPKDFRLQVAPQAQGGPSPDQIPPMILQAIQQAQQATMEAVEQKIAKPAAQELAKDQQVLDQIQETLKRLEGIYQIAAATQEKGAIAMEKAKSDAQRKDFVAAADVKRQDNLAAASVARQNALAQNQAELLEQKTKAELAIEGAKATHGAHLAEKAAAAEPKKSE